MSSSRHLVVLACGVALVCGLQAADRAEITFADARIFPESLTSTKNGDLYFGSLGHDSVYRATSSSTQATTWIKPKSNGLVTVLGVFADESAGVLLVCTSTPGARNTFAGGTMVKAFSLKDASLKAGYAFPGDGLCNDIAVGRDGTTYATDTTQARVMRLKKGATAFDVWASDPTVLAGVDGVALLDDGNVYVNSVGQSTLMRIDVKKDGSAGAITKLETSRPLQGPDGMRSVGKKTLLLVEGGRLDEVTINGNKAEIKVLKEGMPGTTAVTVTGGTAYVAEAKLNLRNDATKDPGPFKAFGIPYKR
jgi:sugar lactone lactonase YvrE